MRLLRNIILVTATLLAVASCWKDDKHRNKYSFSLDSDFEYEQVKFGEDSVFVIENIFVGHPFIGNLIRFAAVVEDEALAGGICLAGGVDTDLSAHAAKTPFHTVAHQYFDEESTFAVFLESGHMPEKVIEANLFNDDCYVQPQCVFVNNTHRFVQAVLYGTGLVGGPFTAEDWAAVTFTGYLKGKKTGEVTLRLADMSKAEDPVVMKWETVDLTTLGSVDEVRLALTSSREDMVKDVCLDHFVFKCYVEY